MPPNAAIVEGIAGGVDLEEYSNAVEGGAAVKLVKGSLFTMADFKPIKALGSGDMGNVFLVAQRSNNAPLAMKVMRKDVLRERKTEHRAQAERDILAAVNHPFLPVLHSHFEDEKRTFLVMNYCHGGDLNVLRHQQPERRFSENACRFYIAEALLALEYLHKRNIVYRDLKPENILIQSDGHIMLTDFDLSLDLSERKWTKPIKTIEPVNKLGRKKSTKANHVKAFFACGSPVALAKKQSKKSPNSRVTPEEMHSSKIRGSGKRITADGPAHSFVGTEEYVAPEIVWGRGHGFPVDWWTLGILLHELFYGRTPFKGENRKGTFYSVLCKEVTFPGIPTGLTDLIRKLLAKEPEDRLGTKGGADEIKKHRFFEGVNWEELEYVTRPPVVPEPFSWEQIEEHLVAKAKASGKEVQTKWSFCETTEERNHDNSTAKISGPLSLKSNDSAYQARLIAESLMLVDSTDSTSRRDESLEEDRSSVDTFSLDTQSDVDEQRTSTTPKEEVRLADEDVLMEHKLFEDVF